MELSNFTLQDLNYYAATFGFELVEDEGFYYWCGLDDYTSSLLVTRYEFPIHEGNFSALSEAEWTDKLTEVITFIVTNEKI